MGDLDFAHILTFESEHCLQDQLESERALAKLKIFPSSEMQWTFSLLSSFLNELYEFNKPSQKGFKVSRDFGRPNGHFTFIHEKNPKYYFYVKISDHISVFASLQWLKREWTKKQICELSMLRKDGKHRVRAVNQILTFYSMSFENSTEGTKCLINHTPLIYCSHFDFSNIFNFFVKKY